MRPITTPHTTTTFKLVGGGPENDLPVEQGFNGGEEDEPVLRSAWALTDEERRLIAEGGMIELVVFGVGTPPVAMHVVDKSWNVLLGDGEPTGHAVVIRDTPAGERAFTRFEMIRAAGDGCEDTAQYWMQVAYEALLDQEEARG